MRRTWRVLARTSLGMEALFIIYDELFEPHIRTIIERGMVVARYTRIDNVIGARMVHLQEASKYLADRRNRMIVAVADAATITQIVADLRALREREGHGLRAFSMPVSQVV
jgi:hypothetical protein